MESKAQDFDFYNSVTIARAANNRPRCRIYDKIKTHVFPFLLPIAAAYLAPRHPFCFDALELSQPSKKLFKQAYHFITPLSYSVISCSICSFNSFTFSSVINSVCFLYTSYRASSSRLNCSGFLRASSSVHFLRIIMPTHSTKRAQRLPASRTTRRRRRCLQLTE